MLYGGLVALALNVGVVSLPQFLVLAKHRRLQDMMVASPVSPLAYMLGFAVSRLLFAVPGLAALLGLLLAVGWLPAGALPAVVVVVLATWLVGSLIGFTVGTYIDNLSAVGSVANLLGFLLMLLPPVLYPLSLLPGVWQTVALLLPSSSAAYLVRGAAHAEPLLPGQTVLAVTVLAGYLVGCTLLVALKSRWREA